MLFPLAVKLSTAKGLSMEVEMLRGVYPERSEGLSMTRLRYLTLIPNCGMLKSIKSVVSWIANPCWPQIRHTLLKRSLLSKKGLQICLEKW